MKLFKIFTLEIIFYIILGLVAITYYVINGIENESFTDFIISAIMLIILFTITISKINDKRKSLNENSNS